MSLLDKRLEIFRMAATLSNFSDAAAALGMTQSNITQRIAGLEKEFGIRLFEPSGRGRRLTPAGTALLEKRAAEENCDIVLYGHTHVPRIDYIAGRYYLNPGSLRQPAEGHPGYIELNVDGKNTVPIRVEI